MSAAETAAALGVSRNAVCGRISRLKLDSAKPKKPVKPVKEKRSPRPRNQHAKADAFFSESDPPVAAPPLAPCASRHLPVGFLSLKSYHCRAPVWDPSGETKLGEDGLALFCGARKIPGSPYCLHHHNRFVAAHLQHNIERKQANGKARQ